ncbi:uracil-DNA glycosylase [Neomegalonema sp.]|uniref:uracil-DNA glycosylase n=1 Tax=Neomegalonema sp. TaxID=2039713 RepID=UPI00260DF6B9|nr:uracil-DNA glycosylase [Neomegalonema sp.]MDD2869157.1 uracil-DNA glycosylase [Neomegalonema sp.]
MTQTRPLSRETLKAALGWLAELGVDETLAEAPQDRYAEALREAPRLKSGAPPAASAAQPRARPAARPAPAPAAAPVAPDPQEAAAASLASAARKAPDLDALKAVLEAFQHPLRAGARRAVFEDGLRGARLMVVGEAPGADEDRLGKPFVGRSGQLLDKMLAAIGLDRSKSDPKEAFYLGNILPFRPPGNRTPSLAEVEVFRPALERQIALARPEILLLAGGTPTKALLRTETGIMRLRGTWSLVQVEGRELPALPLFHPAFLLRAPAMKALAWRDLLSLRRRLDGG